MYFIIILLLTIGTPALQAVDHDPLFGVYNGTAADSTLFPRVFSEVEAEPGGSPLCGPAVRPEPAVRREVPEGRGDDFWRNGEAPALKELRDKRLQAIYRRYAALKLALGKRGTREEETGHGGAPGREPLFSWEGLPEFDLQQGEAPWRQRELSFRKRLERWGREFRSDYRRESNIWDNRIEERRRALEKWEAEFLKNRRQGVDRFRRQLEQKAAAIRIEEARQVERRRGERLAFQKKLTEILGLYHRGERSLQETRHHVARLEGALSVSGGEKAADLKQRLSHWRRQEGEQRRILAGLEDAFRGLERELREELEKLPLSPLEKELRRLKEEEAFWKRRAQKNLEKEGGLRRRYRERLKKLRGVLSRISPAPEPVPAEREVGNIRKRLGFIEEARAVIERGLARRKGAWDEALQRLHEARKGVVDPRRLEEAKNLSAGIIDGWIRQILAADSPRAVLSGILLAWAADNEMTLESACRQDANLFKLYKKAGGEAGDGLPQGLADHEAVRAGRRHPLYKTFKLMMDQNCFRYPFADRARDEVRRLVYQSALPICRKRCAGLRRQSSGLAAAASGYTAMGSAMLFNPATAPAGVALLAKAAALGGLAVDKGVKADRLAAVIENTRDYSRDRRRENRSLLADLGKIERLSDMESRSREEFRLLEAGPGIRGSDWEVRMGALAREAGYVPARAEELITAVSSARSYLPPGNRQSWAAGLKRVAAELQRELLLAETRLAAQRRRGREDFQRRYRQYRQGLLKDSGLPDQEGLKALFSGKRAGEYGRVTESLRRTGPGAGLDIAGRARGLLQALAPVGAYSAESPSRILKYEYQDLLFRRDEWLLSSRELYQKEQSRLADLKERTEAARDNWERGFRISFRRGKSAWKKAYRRLREERKGWTEKAAAEYREAVMDQLTRRWDLSSSDRAVIRSGAPLPEGGDGLAGAAELEALLEASLVTEKASPAAASAAALAGSKTGPLSLTAAPYDISRYRQALEEGLLRSAALRIRQRIGRGLETLAARIDETNRRVARSTASRLTEAGYSSGGSHFTRTVGVDQSLTGGVEVSRQSIRGYRYFKAPSFELPSGGWRHVGGAAAEGLRKRVTLIRRRFAAFKERILGSSKDEGEGELLRHIGRAPEFSDGGLRQAGSGELGRIFLSFYRQQREQARGAALMERSSWDVRLWDDDRDNDGQSDSFFAAPSYRSAVNMGTSLAAGALTGGAGAFLFNLADDAAFSLADYGAGMAWQEALQGFGRKSAAALLGAGAGGLVSWGGDILGEKIAGAGFDSLTEGLADTALDLSLEAGGTALQVYGGGAINALELKNGGITFNRQRWDRLAAGGAVSVLAGAVSAGLTSGLDNAFYGYHGSMGAELGNLNALLGGAAALSLELALSGTATLNILNASDLTGGGLKGGLLELRLGRNPGIALGGGGRDFSAGRIAASFAGWDVYRQELAIARREGGSRELSAPALRALASAKGDPAAAAYLRELLTGSIGVESGPGRAAGTGRPGSGGFQARTDNRGGRKILHLAGKARTRREALREGLRLAHEAYRDGRIGSRGEQLAETGRAVLAHAGVVQSLARRYGEGFAQGTELLEEAAYLQKAIKEGKLEEMALYLARNYDSSADFWKMTKDGRIIFDRSRDLFDDQGRLLARYNGSGGFTASLAAHLGISTKEANRMMQEAGWTYRNKTFIEEASGVDVRNRADFSLDTPADFKERYLLQRRWIDRADRDFAGSMTAAVRASRENLERELELARASGLGIRPELLARRQRLPELERFARLYDRATARDQWQAPPDERLQGLQEEALERIRQGWSWDDTNPLYENVGDQGPLNPVAGIDSISVRSHYEDGRSHGWQGGRAIDLAPKTGSGQLLQLTAPEDVLLASRNLEWDFPDSPEEGYGYHLRTVAKDFEMIYGHLQPGSPESRELQSLIRAGQAGGLFRFTLPGGYSFGRLGNTGHSTGPHLHWELRPLWPD